MEACKGWMSRDGSQGAWISCISEFYTELSVSSRVSFYFVRKTIFWSKPELNKKYAVQDLWLKVPHNSEAYFFFLGVKSKGKFCAGSNMFPENAPPLCKVYYESWKGHAETSGQGLLAERRQEEAKTHLGDSSEVGKSRQTEAQSYGLGHIIIWTSFVRVTDSEFYKYLLGSFLGHKILCLLS